MNTISSNPYIGPRTFQKNEGHLFYGREREARDLIALVASERLVVFYAQSGAGKSSIVNTRLIPNLETKEYEVLPAGRVGGDSAANIDVENIYVYNLLRSLEQHETLPVVLAKLSLSEYFAHLNVDENGFFYDSKPIEAIQEGDNVEIVRRALVIDQFEELFSTHPEAWEKRDDFFRQLAKAMEDDPYLWVVLVMREDYIASLDPYAHYVENGLRVRYYMQRLERESALKAVTSPVEELRPYAKGVAEKLIDDLCSIAVIKPDGTPDVQPGQYVEPVQLQVVCYGLWNNLSSEGKQITEKDLEDVGDVSQSLGKHYDRRVSEVAKAKKVKERLIREWFEKKLITAGGIRNMVLQEHESKPGVLDDDVIQALQSDLVRGEKRGGATWYELTHDRLVDPILQSNKIWFEEHLSPLQRQAALWNEQNRQESWLLKDNAVIEMEVWAGTHQDEITDTEKEFLGACRKLQLQIEEKRAAARNQLEMANKLAEEQANSAKQQALANIRMSKQLRISTIIAGFASLLLVAAILLGIQSNKNQRTTQMQVLLNASSIELEKDENLGTLLAYQALEQFGDHGEVEQALANIAHDMEPRSSDQTPFIIPNTNYGVGSIALNSDGQILAAGYSDGRIYLIDMTTRSFIGNPLTGHTANITSLSFSPDGKMLASGSWDNTIMLWNVDTGQPIGEPLIRHYDIVTSVVFSPDGKMLASGSWDNTIILWDVATHKLIGDPLVGHSGYVTSVAFSPDGKKLASGSYDTSINLWDVSDNTSPKLITTLLGHTDWVNAIAFSPDGDILASGGDTADPRIILWDVATHKPIGDPLVKSHTNVTSLAFSSDGKTLASGDNNLATYLWDVATHQFILQLPKDYSPVTGLAFSPDGKTLVGSFSLASEITLWDLATGEQKDTIPAPSVQTDKTEVVAMSISLEGYIQGITKTNLKVWNRDKKQIIDTLDFDVDNPIQYLESFASHNNQISAFSSDGKYRVDGGTNVAIVYGLASGEKIAQMRHRANVNAVAFSQNGDYVASADERNIIRIWDAKSGEEVARIKSEIKSNPYVSFVSSVSFSPDASRIVIAYYDDQSTVEVWDINSKQKILVIANRQLQPLGYTVASSASLLNRKGNELNVSDDEAKNEQFGNPVADVAYLQDGLFILYNNGIVDQWDIWPSRADLKSYALKICDPCELTNEQRQHYGLYTWPMRVQDYAGYLFTFFMVSVFGFGALRIYRTVFKNPIPIDENTKPGFTWKKFLSASAQGMAFTLIGFFGWTIIGLFETIIYFRQARDPSDTIFSLVFLLLPLGLWTGGAYSHLTRLHSGKWSRTKRTFIGTLAGLLGGSFAGLLGSVAIYYVVERSYDIGIEEVLLVSLVVGVIVGIMSLFGALAYIFVLHPWAGAKKMTRGVEFIFQLLFGAGMFFENKNAKRKWIYPIAVLAMTSFWLLAGFDLDYTYLGRDIISDESALLLGFIGLIIHLFGLFDFWRSNKLAAQKTEKDQNDVNSAITEQLAAGTKSRKTINDRLQIWWSRGLIVSVVMTVLGFVLFYLAEGGYYYSYSNVPILIIAIIIGVFGFMFYPHKISYIMTAVFTVLGTVIWYPVYQYMTNALYVALWFGLGSGFILSAIISRILHAIKKI